jgi:hypothetical protein
LYHVKGKGLYLHPSFPSFPPFRSTNQKYWKTKSMKKHKYPEANRRARFKKRNLGYLPLFDNPYPRYDIRSVDMHHVNRIVCIPLPHRTHMLIKGRDSKKHKQHCKEWIQKLYLIDIDYLFRP